MKNKIAWPISTPKQYNMDQECFEKIEKAVKKTKVKSCLIIKEGALVYQYYKSNKIRDNLQRINSCTKSVISILIGIAIQEGFIPSVDPGTLFF